ncbi:hypothetical protein QJS10_CPB04g01679 [Acorus calamus]|uniref:Uncharacterized protein n=1 Tax=Acorus calamus TaxID=4465 RepID=A0AAV9F277_ACOCL|nr:hypothetical protein QJS10_CPB04g01679 [Acorus calamus]
MEGTLYHLSKEGRDELCSDGVAIHRPRYFGELLWQHRKDLTLLGSVFFDLLFVIQHYILYPFKTDTFPVISEETVVTPLLKSPDTSEESSTV